MKSEKDAAIDEPDEIMEAVYEKFLKDSASGVHPRKIFRDSFQYSFVVAGMMLFNIEDVEKRRVVFNDMMRILVLEFLSLNKATCDPDKEVSEILAEYYKSKRE